MKKLVLALLFVFMFSSVASVAVAGSVKLEWNPSPEPDIDGYIIYYWEEGIGTEQSIDVGNVTTYELTGLTTGKYYIIEATAYDTSANESERSYGVRGKARFSTVERLGIRG